MDADVRRRLIRNAVVSLGLYALPVVLMFLSFYLTGARPWQKIIPPGPGTALNGRHIGDLK